MGLSKQTIEISGETKRLEGPAGAAINPGYIIETRSDGKFYACQNADYKVSPVFACENEIFGRGITIAYAAGDNVLASSKEPGDRVNAKLAAAAAAIVVGDMLTSAGNGTLKKAAATAAGAASAVAVAEEAVNNSAGATEVFIEVRII
jgi:hypothetical protein